jgi:hypothetical protein
MWIAYNLSEERGDGRVHYWTGLCPVAIDKQLVEQAKFMSIDIRPKAELKNVSTRS